LVGSASMDGFVSQLLIHTELRCTVNHTSKWHQVGLSLFNYCVFRLP